MTARPKGVVRRKVKPGKSPSHLDLVRQLPCILSGRPAEVAHLRFASVEYDKDETGVGRKPDDKWVLPLCPELHRLNKGCQHDCGNERAWWMQFHIDPLAVARSLWGKPRIHMERIIIMATPWDPAIKAKIAAILKGGKT